MAAGSDSLLELVLYVMYVIETGNADLQIHDFFMCSNRASYDNLRDVCLCHTTLMILVSLLSGRCHLPYYSIE